MTRYAFAAVLLIIFCSQFVIYVSTRKRPKWFIAAELLAMVSTFAASATALDNKDGGLMVAGVFVLFGFVEFNVATAVYLYQRDRVDSATFLRRYWYIPIGIISLFMFLFLAAERSNRDNGPVSTEILSQTKKNGIVSSRNLKISEEIIQRSDVSLSQRQQQISLLDELNDTMLKLFMPLRQDIKDIKAEQQRDKIRYQKLDQKLEEIKRNTHNGL